MILILDSSFLYYLYIFSIFSITSVYSFDLYCLSQESSRPWTKYVPRLELTNTFFHLSGDLPFDRENSSTLRPFFTGFRGILRDLNAALKSK